MKPSFFSILTFVLVLILLSGVAAEPVKLDHTSNMTPEPFWIQIDPIADHHVGDIFTISGTTNHPAGQNMSLDIYSDFFIPGGGSYQDRRSVEISKNVSFNTWSTTINSSTIHLSYFIDTGRYHTEFVAAVNYEDNVTNYTIFQLYPANQSSPVKTPPPPSHAVPLPVLLPLLSLVFASVLCMGARREQ
jgi:hypothetical protein